MRPRFVAAELLCELELRTLSLWLCHADARQSHGVTGRASGLETRLSRRLAAHRSGRAISRVARMHQIPRMNGGQHSCYILFVPSTAFSPGFRRLVLDRLEGQRIVFL